MEELTENAEEPDDGEEKKEEQKLGKLQYKVGHETRAASYEDQGTSLNTVLSFKKNVKQRPWPIKFISNFSYY